MILYIAKCGTVYFPSGEEWEWIVIKYFTSTAGGNNELQRTSQHNTTRIQHAGEGGAADSGTHTA